ncbi:hypothetical protein BQ8794_140224 [Mesorhizobium prunaredense]|uniref:Uncharacterized protein n=1 Tax=Mesorhizobium prunaredense TaxID=1631249 RepID=A0A1R3V2J6_9HYPH|nr:hypothetical protein BQ8794_140224 [Mesorhizobium prunaredense]
MIRLVFQPILTIRSQFGRGHGRSGAALAVVHIPLYLKGLRGFHGAFVTKKHLALKGECSCSIRTAPLIK